VAEIQRRWPSDFAWVNVNTYEPSPRAKGDPYVVGVSTDDWGCVFENIHDGIIGEVKNPQIERIEDWDKVQPPYEILPRDWVVARKKINEAYAQSDKFMVSGCCPRPWERLQFLRGTVNAMMDVMEETDEFKKLLARIHDFYMAEAEFWVKTDVDSLNFMDDWGSQTALLIPPEKWRKWFKPMYKDYCELAHAHGKFAFMHSDGYIQEVYPDLVEIGVDALNSQLFCMDMEVLAKVAKGKLTFWGEIDRQHVLPAKDPEVGRNAVREVYKHLYDPRGGIIVQFELGVGSNPATAIAICEEWDSLTGK